MSKEKILDLGTGGGGNYIRENPTERLCVDRLSSEDEAVVDLLERYPYCEYLYHNLAEGSLPFNCESFKEVDIILPNLELLERLRRDSFFHKELYRVLVRNGLVRIITDITRPYPWRVKEIETKSKKAGFKPKHRRIYPAELSEIGTLTALGFCLGSAKVSEIKLEK